MIVHSFSRDSFLFKTLLCFKKEFIYVGLLSLVLNISLLTPTLYMLQVYDRVLQSRNELTLLAVSLLALGCFFFMAIVEWLRSRILIRSGVQLDERLRAQIFHATYSADLNNDTRASNAFSDMIQLRQFLTSTGVVTFFDVPWTPIYLAVLFLLNPWLGVMGILAGLLQLLLAVLGHNSVKKSLSDAEHSKANSMLFVQNKLKNSDVIEAMGMLDNLGSRWINNNRNYIVRNFDAQYLQNKFLSLSKSIRYSQQSIVLGVGALLVIVGDLSPGAMIAATVLMTRALVPIDSLMSGWKNLANLKAAFARLDSLLILYPTRRLSQNKINPKSEISLLNVSAFADGRPLPILQNISMTIAHGSVTLLMGPSGSGKSTLAKVIVGIWPKTEGKVLIGDIDISNWDRLDLGSHVGYLSQDVELLEGSIAENIARFDDINAEKIIKASKSVGLHEMILKFPHGYDTEIEQINGVLTGGQRQRIGLARAAYGSPAFVVLDEPNSNLDDEGNASLYKTVEMLKSAGSIVLLITHRPINLSIVDQIVMLKEGAIRICGSPDKVVTFLKDEQERTQTLVNASPVSSNS